MQSVENHSSLSEIALDVYFQAISDGDFDIVAINEREDANSYCQSCYSDLMIDNYEYYYCQECQLNMCLECSDIHIHKLEKKHHLGCVHKCNTCHEVITDISLYAQDQLKICLSCHEHCENKEQFSLEDNTIDYKIGMPDFGELIDWMPVLIDDETDDMLLFNMKKEEVGCRAVDKKNRMGYFSLPDLTLDQAIMSLAKYAKDSDYRGLTGWDRFYNSPIKRLMLSCGLPVHYG